MRKENLIDKPIAVSLFGTVASATLMVAFAIAYRIAGLLFLTRMLSWWQFTVLFRFAGIF